MQTKKRARPVKFGKAVKKDEPKVEKEEKLEKPKKETAEPEEVKETHVSKKEVVEDVEEESPEATEEVKEEAASESETEEKDSDEGTYPDEEDEQVEEQNEEDVKKATFGSFTKEDEQKGRSKKGGFGFFFLVAFLTFLIGLAVISGISYLMPDQKESLKVVSTDENSNPEPTVEPTTAPEEVDLTAYAVEVLNGSGTTGEAAKVKTQLETAGFKVGTVGNADTSDYTKTVISAKKSVNQQYLNKLMEELKKTYEVNGVVESATGSQTSDVVVTIGSSTVE